MYLFFDTETTGLPRNWNAPTTDTDNWPRLVQLAWQLHDAEGHKIGENNLIIKPNGFIIPTDASRVHGITQDRANLEGIPIRDALEIFAEALGHAKHLVAHNMSFDEKIVGAEFLRNDMVDPVASKAKICTMLTSVDFCAIQGNRGYKWPKLAELHQILFGEGFAEAHNAAADINATAKCFWALAERGVITLEKPRLPNVGEKTSGEQLGLF